MADDNDKDAQEEPKSNKLLIIIIVVLVVLLVAVGVGVFLMMGSSNGGGDEEDFDSAAESMAIYYDLKPPFVVNYSWKGRQRYVQISLAVLTRKEASIEALKKHKPLVRNNLVQLFGSQDFDALQTPEGKELLRQVALESLQKIVVDEIGEEGIEKVLFTNFVMQ